MADVPLGDRGGDPVPGAKIRLVLRQWEGLGHVQPGWTVEYDTGEGAYRATFTLTAFGHAHHYSFTEAEFGQYLIGLADLAPATVGPRAVELADEMRDEVSKP